MQVRIYTIPARDVVPGMTVRLYDWPARFVDEAKVKADIVTLRHALGFIRVVPWFVVEVTMPGPSPRELLCDCGPWPNDRHITAPWAQHPYDCPVHDLRLRMWAVGATWDAEWQGVGAWIFWFDHGDFKSFLPVTADHLRKGLPHMILETREELLAAFCEPEVQT